MSAVEINPDDPDTLAGFLEQTDLEEGCAAELADLLLDMADNDIVILADDSDDDFIAVTLRIPKK